MWLRGKQTTRNHDILYTSIICDTTPYYSDEGGGGCTFPVFSILISQHNSTCQTNHPWSKQCQPWDLSSFLSHFLYTTSICMWHVALGTVFVSLSLSKLWLENISDCHLLWHVYSCYLIENVWQHPWLWEKSHCRMNKWRNSLSNNIICS